MWACLICAFLVYICEHTTAQVGRFLKIRKRMGFQTHHKSKLSTFKWISRNEYTDHQKTLKKTFGSQL